MMHQARGARSLLMRVQPARQKREANQATCDQAAWIEHCATGLMGAALSRFSPALIRSLRGLPAKCDFGPSWTSCRPSSLAPARSCGPRPGRRNRVIGAHPSSGSTRGPARPPTHFLLNVSNVVNCRATPDHGGGGWLVGQPTRGRGR
jgi:hypothetical protein